MIPFRAKQIVWLHKMKDVKNLSPRTINKKAFRHVKGQKKGPVMEERTQKQCFLTE